MGALWAMGHSTGPAKKAAAPTTRVDKDICHFLRIAPPDDTFRVPVLSSGSEPSVPAVVQRTSGCLLREAYLLHEREVVPEEILLIHHAVLPMPDRDHFELEWFVGGRNGSPGTDRHRTGEGAFEDRHDRRPICLPDLDRMSADARVGRIDEHRPQVLDVLLETRGHAAIRPVNRDGVGMTPGQFIPLLVGEHVEVEIVEVLEARLHQRVSPLELLELRAPGIEHDHRQHHEYSEPQQPSHSLRASHLSHHDLPDWCCDTICDNTYTAQKSNPVHPWCHSTRSS